MGEQRLIVVDMDYGSQSETLENCGMWKFERWQYQHRDYFGCLVLISFCSVEIFHAEIALMIDVYQVFCYLQRC